MLGKFFKMAQETPTATPGPTPSVEDILNCVAFRVLGGEMTPRISHITGTEEEATQTIPAEIEWLIPRISCLVGLFEEKPEPLKVRKAVIKRQKPVSSPPRAVPAARTTARRKGAGYGVNIPSARKLPVRNVAPVVRQRAPVVKQKVAPVTTRVRPAPPVPPRRPLQTQARAQAAAAAKSRPAPPVQRRQAQTPQTRIAQTQSAARYIIRP